MNLSITSKLLITLVAVFTLVLASSTGYQYYQQRNLLNSVLSEQLHDKASNYFDSLNMMMLTGTMSQKETLHQKALAQGGIEEVRVIRSETVNKLYGMGTVGQQAQDDIDRRALNGETIIEPFTAEWGKGLVVALPMKASENYRGTNCIACHMATEGEVLGVIRLEYNLNSLNSMISQRTFIAIAIMTIIAGIGFVAALYVIRKIIIKPLKQTSLFMRDVSQNRNLTLRLTSSRKDEVGQLTSDINSLLESVSNGMTQVQKTSHSLAMAATELTDVAKATEDATTNQLSESADVRHNMLELQQQQQNIEQATREASGLITHTTDTARNSATTAHQASQDIQSLVSDIEEVKTQIGELNQQTDQVTTILAVIKSVAEQTNLLALNAAIEAARAGENGRGFAVVADEVRQLASRTQEATGSIQSIIEQLQNGSSQSMASVDEVCQQAHIRAESVDELSRILSEVTEQMQQANIHASSVQDQVGMQTQVSSNVSDKISAITTHAEKTSHSAGQTREICMYLEHTSEQLELLLKQFTLPDNNKG
ncbi:methyl-accepting chemotaxis protein [Vibrio tapetis]|uniref:Putative Metal dependent phosphohydrolase fused with Methyl-accepting protein n=1 Tax=Vibrio tapetis subsp. tapetis TaxID=1671868 RepID=A0A2N8ZAB5_9VIBR|nr:methyl-accepting chemotaxis protein [Vibrio tapetis]SON48827.1 putative Metal dependent phosphohydrolase fused with Methyl-accepting protein [Vibrio tapetis subsp. tapetis]